MKMLDLLIKGGHIIDMSTGRDGIGDLGITGNRIESCSGQKHAKTVVDATGCLVIPGLIDAHTHIYYRQPDMRTPDLMLADGVTTVLDVGTTGVTHWEEYYDFFSNALLRIKSVMNIAPGGLVDFYRYGKEPDYSFSSFDAARYREVINRHRDQIVGVKIIFGKHLAKDAEPLRRTIEFANSVDGLRVFVHALNPPCPSWEIAELLRPGDVFIHCYQGVDHTILNEGKVDSRIWKAKERGVIFDCACGRRNFSFNIAKAAIKQGFFPDVISTDYVNRLDNASDYSSKLVLNMAKFISLGMDLHDVMRAVGETPAELLDMEGVIGTLAPESIADVTILKPQYCDVLFHNYDDTEHEQGNMVLVPKMTIKDGKVVYRSSDFLNS